MDNLRKILPDTHSLAYCTPSTLKSALVYTGPPRNKRGVVYQVKCNACPTQYIGETGNTLEKRIRDHKYAIRTCNDNNAIFKHLSETGHTMDLNNPTTLIITKKNNI